MYIQAPIINLRGGGCGTGKINAFEPEKIKFHSELPASLLSLTSARVENLSSKMLQRADKTIQDEYLNTINWLDVNEYWYQRIPNDKSKMVNCIKLLQLTLKDILQIVESIIDGSRFIAYSLMRVANNYSRIMVVYYTNNEGTFLDLELSNGLKEMINCIKEKIKKNETALYYNGLYYESGITEACINICPVDDPQGKELGFKALAEIVKSAASLSPSKDLFSSLGDLAFFGVKVLYQKYRESNFKEMMTKCIFIEQFKWTIVTCIERETFSIKQIFNTLSNFYKNEVLCSKSWEVKYCWIKIMHWIMAYRVIITKEMWQQQIERIDQFWYQLAQEQIIQIIGRTDQGMGAIVNEEVTKNIDLSTSNPIYLDIINHLRTINRIKTQLFNGSDTLPQILNYDQAFSHSLDQENETNKMINHVQNELQCFQIGNIINQLQQIIKLLNNLVINTSDLGELFNDSATDQNVLRDICQQARVISRQLQELKHLMASLHLFVTQFRLVLDNWLKMIFSDNQLQQLHYKLEQKISFKCIVTSICAVLRQFFIQRSNNHQHNLEAIKSNTEYVRKMLELLTNQTIHNEALKTKIIEKLQSISQTLHSNINISSDIDEIESISQIIVGDIQRESQFINIIELGIDLSYCKTSLNDIDFHLDSLYSMNLLYSTLSYLPPCTEEKVTIQYTGVISISIDIKSRFAQFNNIQQQFQMLLSNKLSLNRLYDILNKKSISLQLTALQNKQILEEMVSLNWKHLEISKLINQENNIKLQSNKSLKHMDRILDLQQSFIQNNDLMIKKFQQFMSNLQSINSLQTKKNIQQSDTLMNLKQLFERTKTKLIDLPINKFINLFETLLTQDQNYKAQFYTLNQHLNMNQLNMIQLNEDLFRKIQLPQRSANKESQNSAEVEKSNDLNTQVMNILNLINQSINMKNVLKIQELISIELLNSLENTNLSEQICQKLIFKFNLFNQIDSRDFIQIDMLTSEILSYLAQVHVELYKIQEENSNNDFLERKQSSQQIKVFFRDNSAYHQQYQFYTQSLKQIIKFTDDNQDDQKQFMNSKKDQIENLINLINQNFDKILTYELIYSVNSDQEMQCLNVQTLIELLNIPLNINEDVLKQFLAQDQSSSIQLIQKPVDGDQWRYRECQIFYVIITQKRLNNQYQIEYGRKLVIYKAIETESRIQKILRSSDFMQEQQFALEKHWKSQSSTIQSLISGQLFKLQQLQKQIQSQQPGSDRDQFLLDHETLENQIDEQIENVSSIGSQLGITIAFIKDLKKELMILQDSLKELNMKMDDIALDIKFLIGKSPQQLLEIRMERVLNQKTIDDARNVFVQLYTKEMIDFDKKIEFEDENAVLNSDERQNGEIDEFIRASRQQSLLLHGPAGSGKSSVAKRVEEYLWIRYKQQRISNWYDRQETPIIPIFIQLPSLKDPKFKALQETLKSQNYQFNDKQINELQHAVIDRQIKLFIIIDSYDELNRHYIEQNLNVTNKFDQWCNGQNYQILNTSRSEILTKQEYRSWFTVTNNKPSKQNFKELRILPFNSKQRDYYYEQYSKLSLKQSIIDIYDVLFDKKKIMLDTALIINDLWEQISKFLNNSYGSDKLLDSTQINQIVSLINAQQNYKIDLYKDQELHFRQKLNDLWSPSMYKNTIDKLRIIKLVETPYMTNIVVSVLPQLIEEHSSQEHLKLVFLRNIEDNLSQNTIIKLHPIEIWDILIESKVLNEYKITNTEIYSNIISQISKQVYQKLQNTKLDNNQEETNNLFSSLEALIKPYIEHQQVEFDQEILFNIFKDKQHLIYDPRMKQLLQILLHNQEIVDSIKSNQPTSYDFYQLFLSEFIRTQTKKLSYKQMNFRISTYFENANDYAQNLGTLMTVNQMTLIEYQQQGIINKQTSDEFEDKVFQLLDDNAPHSSIKAQIRTSLPLKIRGNSYSFFHKSIQEYLFAKNFIDLLEYMKQLKKLKIDELFEYRKSQSYKDWDYSQIKSYEVFRKSHKMKVDQVKNLIKCSEYLSKHFINQKIYQDEFFIGSINFIINKIQQNKELLKITLMLIKISKLGNTFQKCSSNCFHIINKAQISLNEQDLSGIHLTKISIRNCNLRNADLSYSNFNKIDINGINLVNASLAHCKWQNLMSNELPILKLKSEVLCIAYSPNNLNIASGTEDGILQICDALSGTIISESKGHTGQICSLSYSHDGKCIASGGEDQLIIFWDVQSAKQIREHMSGHTRKVSTLTYSPDDMFLASGAEDNTIRIWDVQSRKQIGETLTGHTGYVLSVKYSPDGKYIASGSADGTIRIWNSLSRMQVGQSINGHIGYVWSVSYSPDSQFIASGDDKSIKIWNAHSGRQIGENLDGHTGYVRSISYSPDGRYIASGSADNSVKIWDVQLGRYLGESLTGHSGSVRSLSYSFDGQFIASGSEDNTVRIWDARSPKYFEDISNGHTDSVMAVSYAPDGRFIASVSRDKTFKIWSSESGQQILSTNCHVDQVRCVTFSPDGKLIATGSGDKMIKLWDIRSGRQVGQTLNGHESLVLTVMYSPNGRFIVSGSDDNTVRIWDVELQKQIGDSLDHAGSVFSVSYSPDGKFIASGSGDHSVRIWDTDSRYQIGQNLNGHTDNVTSVSYSPDGNFIASGSGDYTIRIWDAKSGQQILCMNGHTGYVWSVSYSPDGKFIVSGGGDKTVRLWNTQSGEQVGQNLIGHTGEVNSVMYAPDGKCIVSGSDDQTLRIWDVQFSNLDIDNKVFNYYLKIHQIQSLQDSSQLQQNHCLLRIPNRGPIMYHGCEVNDAQIESRLGINILQLWQYRQNQIQ